MFFVPRSRTEAAERAFSYGGQSYKMVGTKPLELDCPLLGLRQESTSFCVFLKCWYHSLNTEKYIEDITWPRGDTKFRCAHS